ncbi:MAG: Uma2 family endonuclease [bacterium]
MGIALEELDALKKGERQPLDTPLSQKAPDRSPKLTLEKADDIAAGRVFELIDGRIVYKMADAKHSRTQARLCGKLVNYFENNQIGQVFTEFTLRLWPENPHESRVPDLSIIFNENLAPQERYAKRAPDIAVEIISQDDRWSDLFEKANLYFETGGREVWLVDPLQQGVLIMTRSARRWEWKELASPELLPGFCVALQDIFAWPVAAPLTAST